MLTPFESLVSQTSLLSPTYWANTHSDTRTTWKCDDDAIQFRAVERTANERSAGVGPADLARERPDSVPHVQPGESVMSTSQSRTERVTRWLPVVLRAVAVTIAAYPAVQKFIEYSSQVGQFAAWGVPWPAVAVPLSGVAELFAVVSLAFGIAGRLGGATLAVTMVVAIAAAGPNPFNVVVLLASVGICVLGTGPYSYWNLSVSDLPEVTRRRGDYARS